MLSELKKLQRVNSQLRFAIYQNISSSSTMDLINELIENEIQQESLCNQ